MLKHYEIVEQGSTTEMFQMIAQMSEILDALASGEIPNDTTYTFQDLAHYLRSLVTHQRGSLGSTKPGSFSVALTDSGMDSDGRVDFIFQPTYIATATLSRVFQDDPDLCSMIPGYEEALRTALDFCVKRGLAVDNADDQILGLAHILTIFEKGRIFELLARTPELSPELLELLQTIRRYLRHRLETKKTQSGPFMGTPVERAPEIEAMVAALDSLPSEPPRRMRPMRRGAGSEPALREPRRGAGGGALETRPDPADAPPLLRVFVYGTLKRGFSNHHYCAGYRACRKATVIGRLYGSDQVSYPYLAVPKETLLGEGSSDLDHDIRNPQTLHPLLKDLLAKAPGLLGPWSLIEGELFTFTDAAERLSRLDSLEGFDPTGRSHYRRVLVPAIVDSRITPSWVYVIDPQDFPGATPLPGTVWEEE